jgi:hypothetical protein
MRSFAVALLLTACRSAPDPAPAPAGRAAVIVNPTPQSRAALLQALTDALGVKVTVVADDALTRESTLLLERVAHRDAAGQRIQGRELTPPERFRLEIAGGECVLIHERTGRRLPLVATECAPSP